MEIPQQLVDVGFDGWTILVLFITSFMHAVMYAGLYDGRLFASHLAPAVILYMKGVISLTGVAMLAVLFGATWFHAAHQRTLRQLSYSTDAKKNE